MGQQSSRKSIAYLPIVFVATFLVLIVPVLSVYWLRTSGVVASAWVGMIIGVVASLMASYAGAAFWKTRTHSRDFLFSELMLWGWVQRWRNERRLNAAADLLGLTTKRPRAISGGWLTSEKQAVLLTQLTSGLEGRDPYTHGHSRRVARHAANIAQRMGLPREEVAKIRAAGAMHDVGKVDTPIAVLHKDGRLSDDEYAIIKRHPVDGAMMVARLHDEGLTAMVRHHHERMDGTGYPDGLVGDAIPIGARILAVADTFDAVTSTRPYRQAHAHKKALDILAAEAGTQLDPDAVRAFCSYYSGRRPLAYWAILLNGRPTLASWLGEGLLGPAKASTIGTAMATAATAAAVGGILLGPPTEAPAGSLRTEVEAGASPASSTSGPRPRAVTPVVIPALARLAISTRGRSPSPVSRDSPDAGWTKTSGPRDVSGPLQRSRRLATTGRGAKARRRSSHDAAEPSRPAKPNEPVNTGQTNGAGGTPATGQPTGTRPGKTKNEGKKSGKGHGRKPGKGQGKAPDEGPTVSQPPSDSADDGPGKAPGKPSRHENAPPGRRGVSQAALSASQP